MYQTETSFQEMVRAQHSIEQGLPRSQAMKAVKSWCLNLLKPLSGTQLGDLFANQDFLPKLFPNNISLSPEDSIEKIKKIFDLKSLSSDGHEIPGVKEIRSALSKVAKHDILNALTIVAPHTHWPIESPMIYTYDEKAEGYLIGLHPINPDEVYKPVTFVFSKDGILPYEWSDSLCISTRTNSVKRSTY